MQKDVCLRIGIKTLNSHVAYLGTNSGPSLALKGLSI